jgi:N-acetylmuramoyl-L-alanine amidase
VPIPIITHIPKRLVVHCSATPNNQPINLKALEKDHIERGFGGIGYHAIIQPDGEFEWTRGINEIGCHVAGANSGSIGVCLVGLNRFTPRQFEILRKIYKDLVTLYPSVKPWQIYSHAEFASAVAQKKTCPNINAKVLGYFLISNDYMALDDYLYQTKGRL